MNPLTDRRDFLRQTSAASLACVGALAPAAVARADEATSGQRLRAGTAQVDITPQKSPVLVCGGFLSRSARKTRCWRAASYWTTVHGVC